MYLFVFVFVIISIMGLYTELMSIRVARIAANQKAAAETMMVWHGAEYEFVKTLMPALGFDAQPCSLTPVYTGPVVPASCTVVGAVHVLPDYTPAPVAFGGRNYLPMGYSYATLQWNTLYYVNGQQYILTFMAPNEVRLGYTANQVYQQMRNSAFPKISYGRIETTTCIGSVPPATRQFVTNEYIAGVQVCYPVPAAAFVPDGSIGIISIIGS